MKKWLFAGVAAASFGGYLAFGETATIISEVDLANTTYVVAKSGTQTSGNPSSDAFVALSIPSATSGAPVEMGGMFGNVSALTGAAKGGTGGKVSLSAATPARKVYGVANGKSSISAAIGVDWDDQ